MFNKQSKILAFVHIEKAAGTTMVNILRQNYGACLCEVRPLDKESQSSFSSADMKKTLKINPYLNSITGHSVHPYSNLKHNFPSIEYVTLFRNPIKRYISHYQYWIEHGISSMSFEQYLDIKKLDNFQTRKIAGDDNLELAKKILKDQFLLVGTVENLDEFLCMLRNEMLPNNFDIRYRSFNIAKDKNLSRELLEKYKDEIYNHNSLDLELYEYVKSELIPRYRELYGSKLKEDVLEFKSNLNNQAPLRFKRYVYHVYKRMYLMPITGLIRLSNGLPYHGSYGVKSAEWV